MNKKNRLVTRPPPLWPSCFPCTSWNVLLEPSCHIPSAQNIESIDSKKFNPGMELFAAWKWLVCYLQERELPIDAKEWKLFHSHQTVIYQGDNHNCGPFSILNTICIHHQYHPNKSMSRAASYWESASYSISLCILEKEAAFVSNGAPNTHLL